MGISHWKSKLVEFVKGVLDSSDSTIVVELLWYQHCRNWRGEPATVEGFWGALLREETIARAIASKNLKLEEHRQKWEYILSEQLGSRSSGNIVTT